MAIIRQNPEESGNYLTNKGWAYYDLKENVWTQGGDEVDGLEFYDDEGDNENPNFSYQELDEDDNVKDALAWLEKNELVGIIDESCGGIIGYVHREHAERINAILNEWKN